MHLDPFLFSDEAISDETRAFNDELREMLLAEPKVSEQTPEEIRRARREGRSWVGPVVHSDHSRRIIIEGPGGDLELRVIEAGDVDGVYLHVHGGGWVLGAADLSDVGNEAMSREANVAVVSVDYRLAPEHPYPAAVEDCAAAAQWLITEGTEEFGTDAFTIGGESAGANLAAATMLKVRDDSGYSSWRGANLVYGSYLPTGTPSVKLWNTDGLILDSDTMEWFAEHYTEGVEVQHDDPYLSPLYGDLTGMPPALFTVGTLDPLLDDTLFMAARWEASGASTTVHVYPGGVHAFDAFPTAIGLEARKSMHEFVRKVAS